MTSINTNVAAMTALQTLQQTNQMLDEAQGRISTGFRVGEAKDNAAYWSIATTMRSDNQATSAVQDALGLGAATVDTAYTGLTATKDVLDEIKAKLTAATQEGVDRSKVQSEITELQNQLKSIAGSATFSGANWLSINSSSDSFSAETSIVSSFSRSASGSVALGSIMVNISDMALFDSSEVGTGILDGEVALVGADGVALSFGGSSSGASLGTGGLTNGTAAVGKATSTAAAFTPSTLIFDDAGDEVTFDITLDGGDTESITIRRGTVQTALNNSDASVTVDTAADMSAVVTQALKDAGVSGVTVGVSAAGELTFTSATKGADSDVVVANAGFTDGGGADTMAAAPELDTVSTTYEKAVATMGRFTDPMTLTGDAEITFSIDVDAGGATAVTIDKDTIGAALGTTDGKINSAYEFQQVVIQALSDASVTGVTVGSLANGAVTFTSTDAGGAGATAAIAITGVTATADTSSPAASEAAAISVAKIDISAAGLASRGVTSNADTQKALAAYISVVDQALSEVTSAAANLGAISSRIEMQQTFLAKLTDTIDKGIGALVDADMTEESTRLKALQTQQQLGVQALSVANQSSQAILQLFR